MNAVEEESASGHYRTAAGALAFMGCVGLGMGALAATSSVDLGFIDANAMFVFSTLFLLVAVAMVMRREEQG